MTAITSLGRTRALAGVVALGLTLALALAGCAPGGTDTGSGDEAARHTPAAIPTVSAGPATPAPASAAPATANPGTTPSPTPAPANQEAPVTTDVLLQITVNGATVAAVLPQSAASTSLVAQLPLDLSFTDFGGQEKIARLPAALDLAGMPSGSAAEPGTIGYYAPDQALVLYYDSVGYYEGIIPLGTFDDVAAVREAPAFTGSVTDR